MANPSDVSKNISARILRNRLLVRLAFMREKDEKRLTATQKRYKYDYNEGIGKTLVCKTNELVFLVKPTLAVKTNNLKAAKKATHNMLMPRADGLYRDINVHHHTLTIDDNDVPNTITIYRAATALSSNRKASVW